MINDSTKHILYIVCENKIFEIGRGKTSGLLNLGRFYFGQILFQEKF